MIISIIFLVTSLTFKLYNYDIAQAFLTDKHIETIKTMIDFKQIKTLRIKTDCFVFHILIP